MLLQTLRSGRELSVRDELELVVRLAVPAALAQVSYILMQYIDASMVGHLGAADSAAVGLVSTTLWLFYGIGGASIMGFSVQTAHRIGAEDFDAASSIVRQAFTTVMTFSAVLAAAGFLISPHLPVWLGGDPSIVGNASDYFLMMALFLPATYFGWLAGALLRATGDMKTPSYLGILMCILNCFFNFLLIFPTSTYTFLGISLTVPGADLGIIGAAVGTIASPVAAERILMCGAQILSTAIVAPLGIVSIAAHTLGITAESLCYMPGYGIGDAASTLVGQSVGAKRLDLAKRIAYKCVGAGMVVMSVMGVVLYFAAPVLMGIMTDVPEVIELGTRVLRIEAWAEPMFAAAIVSYSAFIGTGDTLVPAVMNLSSMWVVRLTLAWFLAPVYGLVGVWSAMCAELIVRGGIFLMRLKSGVWLRKLKQNN